MRFSKTNLIEELWKRIEAIRKEWNFDPMNGTAQLGTNLRRNVAYGEYRALCELVDDIDSGYWITVSRENSNDK